nr:MAG TPA: hypothetical protein [Caudoviricetes sp.]
MPYKHKGDTLLIRNAECVIRNYNQTSQIMRKTKYETKYVREVI